MAKRLPMVVRSLQHLEQQAGAKAPALPFSLEGTTYTMAQVAAWVDPQRYAVGRWDGTMSLFDFSDGLNQGPKITVAVSTPSTEGVQMIEWLADGLIATSNDETSALLWSTAAGDWEDIREAGRLSYDRSLGVVNSAVRYKAGEKIFLVMGHANGFLTIWCGSTARDFTMLCPAVDLTTPHPTNPWGLQNIRGVSLAGQTAGSDVAQVYTGSENGLICVVETPSGRVVSKTIYNPAAQRGINAIASIGPDLLVANCAVGPADKNLWYYRLNAESGIPELKSSFNLAVDEQRAQTFAFDVTWCVYEQGGAMHVGAIVSTEEGYLWVLQLGAGQSMRVVGNEKVTSPLGCALAVNAGGQLAVTAYDLYNYQLGRPAGLGSGQHRSQIAADVLGLLQK